MLLKNDEKIVYEAKKHLMSLFWAFVFTPFLLIVFLASIGAGITTKDSAQLIGGLIFSLILATPVIYSILRFKLDKLVVTNKTFYLQQGVINIERITLPLNKIQSMVVQQGLLGRILNYGDIVYQSASKTGTSVYKFVVNPHELTNILNEYQ